MQTMSQLKSMHEQMMSELANLPQYRALKAMERFLSEMGQIYANEPPAVEKSAEALQQKLNAAIEARVGGELSASPSVRVTPYIPGNRVA